MQKLRVGLVVSYKTNAADQAKMAEHRSVCNVKEELPAVVVAIDEDNYQVNLKVLLDGQGDIWAKDVVQGDEEGQWEFYPEPEELQLSDVDVAIEKALNAKAELEEIINGLDEAKEALLEELGEAALKIEAFENRVTVLLAKDPPAITTDAKKV